MYLPQQYICTESGLQDVSHFGINLMMKKNVLQFIKHSTCRLLGHAEYAQHFETLSGDKIIMKTHVFVIIFINHVSYLFSFV